MLLNIHIENFALIDKADIKFIKGLNMLTGETGAGKSILIDSINFILGNKQNKDIIRIGENSAYVEGVFSYSSQEVNSILEDYGIEIEENIIISREINKSGKSFSRINGRAVTVGLLKSIGKYLIDIHGQHEHQSLLNDESNIKILDLFCGNDLKSVMEKYTLKYEEYTELIKKIENISKNEKERLRIFDLLSFQTQEISEAELKVDEDKDLSDKRDTMRFSEKIFSSLNSVYTNLYMSPIGNSAYDSISASIKDLSSIEEYDEKIKGMKGSLEDIYYRLESVLEDVRGYKASIDFNEDILEDVENRLEVINKLKRKYGSTVEEILEYNESSLKELSDIKNADKLILELEESKDILIKDLEEISVQITNIRKKHANKLKLLIEKELKDLGMEKAIFDVELIEESEFKSNGKNAVRFLMTANAGQPLKAISKVASGGEISRIMLAIKTVIADIDSIPTLIFDEIDTGISGRIAQAVGEKMCKISTRHQILCVTHLPQIASMSDAHFRIEKNTKENFTLTEIKLLNKSEKIEELARMLGGAVITDLTKKNALEVLNLAEHYKTSLKSKKK